MTDETIQSSPFEPRKGDIVLVYTDDGGFRTATFVRYNRAGKPVVIRTGRKREKAYSSVYPVNDGRRIRERGRQIVEGYNDLSQPPKKSRRK